jgi:hypothetical protein
MVFAAVALMNPQLHKLLLAYASDGLLTYWSQPHGCSVFKI